MYNLKETMVKVLNDAQWKTADLGIDKILATWETNKTGLLALFRQYPTWNEERKMIVFSHEYEREIDYKTCDAFRDWLYETEHKPVAEFDTSHIKYNSDIFYVIGRYIYRGLQILTTDEAQEINRHMPELKVRAGQKVSKVVNKFLTKLEFNKHPDYNKEFAKYSDAVNPLKVKRHTCISVNPIDYLLMSNGNSWTSCHRATNPRPDHRRDGEYGCYCSGTMSYMLDETSFLVYTVDEKYDGVEFELQPKITRQVFNYYEGKLVQGRLYPQTWDGNCDGVYTNIRNTIQKVIADCLDKPNMWKLEDEPLYDRDDIKTVNKSTHYADYFENSCCRFSTLKDVAQEDTIVRIGHPPICPECGEEFNVQQSLSCCDEEMVVKCVDCGEVMFIRDMRLDSRTGERFCAKCADWCRCCDTWHRRIDFHHREEVGNVCDDCFESEYVVCPVCNKYEHKDRMNTLDGVYMCNDCRDLSYVRCEDCYEWVKKEDAVEVDKYWREYVCLSCKEKRDIQEAERRKKQEEREREWAMFESEKASWKRADDGTTLEMSLCPDADDMPTITSRRFSNGNYVGMPDAMFEAI